jgi:hypothetical protein
MSATPSPPHTEIPTKVTDRSRLLPVRSSHAPPLAADGICDPGLDRPLAPSDGRHRDLCGLDPGPGGSPRRVVARDCLCRGARGRAYRADVCGREGVAQGTASETNASAKLRHHPRLPPARPLPEREFRYSFRQPTAHGVSRGRSWGAGHAAALKSPRHCWPYEFRQTLLVVRSSSSLVITGASWPAVAGDGSHVLTNEHHG